jgi:hypothetical protein
MEMEGGLVFCRNQTSSYARPAWAFGNDQLPSANLHLEVAKSAKPSGIYITSLAVTRIDRPSLYLVEWPCRKIL